MEMDQPEWVGRSVQEDFQWDKGEEDDVHEQLNARVRRWVADMEPFDEQTWTKV